MRPSSLGSRALAKTTKDDYATDAKTGDRPQSQGLNQLRPEMEQISEEGGQRKNNAQDVQPCRRPRGLHLIAVLQAELQQHSGQSDGTHDDDRQRAEEGSAVGEQHDQGQGSAEQTGGDHRPTSGTENSRVQFHLDGAKPL